jgi:hypothetical protein
MSWRLSWGDDGSLLDLFYVKKIYSTAKALLEHLKMSVRWWSKVGGLRLAGVTGRHASGMPSAG